jgi:adenine-specific DNA-methyltransferase
LIKKILQLSTNKSEQDIVLDFFGGSGTIAQAVIELNKEDNGDRKFILVQLPELTEVDGNDFKATSTASKLGYNTISDISKERIRRIIHKFEKEKTEKPELFEAVKLDLGFKVFKLSPSNFKIWRGNEITEENLESQLEAFTNAIKEGSETENMLYELILKSGYLLTDNVEAKGKYYSINDSELIIALKEITQKLIDKIISEKPKKVIMLDKLFSGNDQLKTNTVLQMKDAEIDFKTI